MSANREKEVVAVEYKEPYHWLLHHSHPLLRDKIVTKNLIDLMKPLKGLTVLDAGCGDGKLSHELTKLGAIVFGIDASKEAIGFAKALVPNAKFEVKNVIKTNFPEKTFDRIVLKDVLEHIPLSKVDTALDELKRILKNNGLMVISVPSEKHPSNNTHYQHFSPHKLHAVLSKFFNAKIFGLEPDSKIYKILAKLSFNRHYSLNFLENFFIRKCNPKNARKLIAVCKKKNE